MSGSIIIAGGGIGGLSAALALHRLGFKPHVLEQADSYDDLGAGIQLSANALHVARALGFEEALRPHVFVPQNARIRNFKTGKAIFTSPLAEAHETRYGAPYWHIHRADLIAVLREATIKAGIALTTGCRVTGYQNHQDAIEVLTQTGSLQADLLVGADGIHSAVQRDMGRQESTFTGQVAWRGLVPAHKIAKGLVPPDATIWVGPGRHFVAYYLRGGELINFVAVEEREQWADESWAQTGSMTQLRKAFAGWHESVETLLAASDECHLWGLFDRPVLPQWHAGRAVLLGDASHPMLPFMAQGGAMALEDAYVLASSLASNLASNLSPNLNNANTLQAALKAYEAARKPRIAYVQSRARANAKLFHLRSAFATGLRRAQFGLAGMIPHAARLPLDRLYGENVTLL